ncbi:MAG: hypothetical protein IKX31_06565 [Muribaculaceae bacterium]|nr:hypothetical protein [Muribaculaceae bacterium]
MNQDASMKQLSITPVYNIAEDEYQNLYDLSVRLCDYITEQIKREKKGALPNSFWWLRTSATRPAFHDLCFVYNGTVYSFLIGVLKDDQILVFGKDWNNFQKETKKYGLQACIIPVKMDDSSIEVLPYLDANTLEPIVFNKKNLNDPLSEWELYCMGVIETLNYLTDNNATKIQYCDVPGINPSIWFTDNEGNPSYVLVRSIPAGLDDNPFFINKKMIDGYKEEGLKGYFVNVKWVNLRGNNGKFMDKQVIHSSIVSSKIELEPIEDVEKNHANIIIEEKEIYEF